MWECIQDKCWYKEQKVHCQQIRRTIKVTTHHIPSITHNYRTVSTTLSTTANSRYPSSTSNEREEAHNIIVLLRTKILHYFLQVTSLTTRLYLYNIYTKDKNNWHTAKGHLKVTSFTLYNMASTASLHEWQRSIKGGEEWNGMHVAKSALYKA